MVDAENRVVIPPQYRDLRKFATGDNILAAQNLQGRWGWISYTGEEIVPCRYDYVGANVCSSLDRIESTDAPIPVKLGDEFFYINLAGERVLF